jgi:RNA polymerase sigma factor for flagellar operon FliA
VRDTVADDSPGPGTQLEIAEVRRQLSSSILALPERERTVLALYYYENLTLAEIGRILGVSESRVCQIHGKAVLQLRSRMISGSRD